MPKKRDELTPLEAALALIVLAAVFFYVYAVPPIEAWWAIWGVWVEFGLLAILILGVGGFIWWRWTTAKWDREAVEKRAKEESERRLRTEREAEQRRQREDLEAREKRRFEAEQAAKGLVKFVPDEPWVSTSPEEADAFPEEPGVRWGTPEQVALWRKEDEERSLPSRVVKAVGAFKPSRQYHDEFAYQVELQGWLKRQFPASSIEKQTGASRPDIVIEDIAIEVKGPTDNRALDTLTTKCLKYSGHYSKVILVLFEPVFSESNFREIKEGIDRMFPHVYVIRK